MSGDVGLNESPHEPRIDGRMHGMIGQAEFVRHTLMRPDVLGRDRV